MPIVIDKLCGKLYLFDFPISSGGTGGNAYLEVNLFSELPLANSASGQIFVVRLPSGTYLINRKESGLYYSNGVTWKRLGDIPSFFDDQNFKIYNNVDNTKQIKFELSGNTTNTTRVINVRNSNGTIAYLNDLNSYLTVNNFIDYTDTIAPSIYLGISNFNSYSANTLININNKVLSSSFNIYSGFTLSNIDTRLLTSTFEIYTGITAPNIYLTKSSFDTYSGLTLTNINSRLITSTYNTFVTTTAPTTYLGISNFNAYSGDTLININNRLLISSFNSYSALTLTNINNRLLISSFNTYSGFTLTNINTRLLSTVFSNYSGITLTNINSRLLISSFATYSASTLSLINTKVDTANNGLNKIGTNVRLGGSLTGNTTITTATGSRLNFSGYPVQYSSNLSTSYNSRSVPDTAYVTGITGNLLLKTIFNTYTGTTAPTTYLSITNFNAYSATTLTNINSRVLSSTYNTFVTTTAPATYLNIINFNTYSGSTLTNINSRLLTTTFASYSATTLTNINNRLLISSFNTYSGLTLTNINSRLLISNFNSYSATTLSLINTKIDSANNGINKIGTNVRLGGSLTGATTITSPATGSRLSFSGFPVQYIADYSANYNSRSFVDKGYVTGYTQIFRYNSGAAPTFAPSTKMFVGQATTNASGVATLQVTLDGLSTGTAIFTNVYSIQATAANNTSTTSAIPFASIQNFASNKTLTINVEQSNSVLIGGQGLTFVSTGIVVYVTIIGS